MELSREVINEPSQEAPLDFSKAPLDFSKAPLDFSEPSQEAPEELKYSAILRPDGRIRSTSKSDRIPTTKPTFPNYTSDHEKKKCGYEFIFNRTKKF